MIVLVSMLLLFHYLKNNSVDQCDDVILAFLHFETSPDTIAVVMMMVEGTHLVCSIVVCKEMFI